MNMMSTKTSAKLTILSTAVLALFGCAAPQQQTAIPPSPTGCYAAMPITTLYGFPITQPRYEPAPCNVINANQPAINMQNGGEDPGEQARQIQQQQQLNQMQWDQQQRDMQDQMFRMQHGGI